MLRKCASVALAVLFMAAGLGGEAMADHRKKHRKWLNFEFYAGPEIIEVPRAMRYVFGGYIFDDEDPSLYDADEEFDEDYYDPSGDVVVKPKPEKKKATTVTKAPLAKPAVKTTTASTTAMQTTAKQKLASTAPEAKPVTSATKTAKAPALTCEKAGQIVSGYGFVDVRPKSCDGQIYVFDAERDGKAFAIKINRANGELSEVTKLN